MALLTAALVLIIGLSVVAANGEGQKTVQDKPRKPEDLGFKSKGVLCELNQKVIKDFVVQEDIHTWLYCQEDTQKRKMVTLAQEDKTLDWFYVESCETNKLSSQFYLKKEELTQSPNKVTLFTISELSDGKEQCEYRMYSLNENAVKYIGGGNCKPVRDPIETIENDRKKNMVDLEPFTECRHFTEWVKTYIDGYIRPDFWPVPGSNEENIYHLYTDKKRNRLLTCTSRTNQKDLQLICLKEQNVHATGWEYWVYLNQDDNRLQRVKVQDCQERFIKKSIFPLKKYKDQDNKVTVLFVQQGSCRRISYTCKGIWYCPATEDRLELCSNTLGQWIIDENFEKWECKIPTVPNGQATTANPSTNTEISNSHLTPAYIEQVKKDLTIPVLSISPVQWWPNDMSQSTGEPKNLLACKSNVGNLEYKLVCLQEPLGAEPRGGEGINKNHFSVYITESNHRLAIVQVRSCYENFITLTILPKKKEYRNIFFRSAMEDYCFVNSYICPADKPCYQVSFRTQCTTEESDLTDYALWDECTGPLSAKEIGTPKKTTPLKAIQDEKLLSFPIEIL